jgi:hypothetical protein
VAVIFEARPDAAVQIASLALKSANAIILKVRTPPPPQQKETGTRTGWTDGVRVESRLLPGYIAQYIMRVCTRGRRCAAAALGCTVRGCVTCACGGGGGGVGGGGQGGSEAQTTNAALVAVSGGRLLGLAHQALHACMHAAAAFD